MIPWLMLGFQFSHDPEEFEGALSYLGRLLELLSAPFVDVTTCVDQMATVVDLSRFMCPMTTC